MRNIEVGGRVRQVTVTRSGAGFAVAADGHTWQIDATRIDAHTLSLLVDRVWPNSIEKEGNGPFSASYEVVIAPDPSTGQLIVHVGALPVPVALNGRRRWGRKDDGAAAGSGPQRVTAPMSGKILRVLVAGGDSVRARQPLVVVEAMKMENELRAGRDGTITEIHASQGISVDAGALLFVIQ